MKAQRLLFLVSWVLLLVLCFFVALGSVGSVFNAYRGADDRLGPLTLQQLTEVAGSGAAVDALHGRRATAATWALAFAVLAGCVVIFSYRRGERWAWWALFIALGLSQLVSSARVFFVGSLGAGTSGILLAILLLGLLAGVPRVFFKQIE